MSCLGLDIGGANLKAADGRGWAQSVAFPLWQQPEKLAAALQELIGSAPTSTLLAVTMTGELCDCFIDKAEGVWSILIAVEEAAGDRETCIYLVDGRFVLPEEARTTAELAAASNWHALASFACRYVPSGTGLLIDVGSTTTDIVPFVNGRVAARGHSDLERLANGELVYTGVRRTPVCAITQTLPYCGEMCTVAAEVFATSADAYLLSGDLDEEPTADWTADGKPFTVAHSRRRLARMLCADAATLGDKALADIATAIRAAQLEQLRRAVDRVIAAMPQPPAVIVTSGSGEFLAQQLASKACHGAQSVSLTEKLGPEVSQCAPAHAVASLASEWV